MMFNLTIDQTQHDLNSKCLLMAVLNVTPDSFSDGGKFISNSNLDLFIEECIKYKVDIIDVGGESSRPGADPISVDEELSRVIPTIIYLQSKTSIPISIDTYKSAVAIEAVDHGAKLINDISAGIQDPNMFKTVSELKVPYIMMHMKGTPKTMQNDTHYEDIIDDILHYFEDRISKLNKNIHNDIILDPGLGFGKSLSDNYTIVNNLNRFNYLGMPILIGASRKSFLKNEYAIEANQRDIETIAMHSISIYNGARIIRTHNIEYGRKMIEICNHFINP